MTDLSKLNCSKSLGACSWPKVLFSALVAALMLMTSLASVSGVKAQLDTDSDDASVTEAVTGSVVQIWARRLLSGNVEFGLRVDNSDVPLKFRYLLYESAVVDKWYYSEPVVVGRTGWQASVEVRARRLPSGNVEFGLRINGTELWVPVQRYLLYEEAEGDTSRRYSSIYYTKRTGTDCSNDIVVPAPASNPGLVKDCEALLKIKDSLTSNDEESLSSWSIDRPITSWKYVYTDKVTSGGSLVDRVTTLRLWEPALSGVIPPEIGDLEYLEVLTLTDLYGNKNITGAIPEELTNLSRLQELRLFELGLTGLLPPSIGRLGNLRVLLIEGSVIGGGGITGQIPLGVASLSNLEVLHLGGNKLNGAIPSGLGNLSKLRTLNLSKNELTGQIPVSLTRLSALQRLHLEENRLSGWIPLEVANLTSLLALHLNDNQLEGFIPAFLPSTLVDLELENNRLVGAIPPSLGDLPNLEIAIFRRSASPGDNPGLTCIPKGVEAAFLTLKEGLRECP